MTRTPARPPALHGKLFRGSEQVRAGVLTPAQLRSSAWRRLFPDVYACASLPVTHHRRARAVGDYCCPARCSAGAAPPCCGVHVTRRRLPDDATLRRDGVLLTTPLRTALDLARIQPLEEAIVALDQFLRSRLVTLPDLRAAAAATTGPGCRGIRLAATHADGLAQSPRGTRVRLLLHASSLPRPVAQHVVRDAEGQFVAQVDFGWPEHKVTLEYDGVWHGAAQQVGKDRRRLNPLTAAGWTVIFVTAADLRDPIAVLARLGAALRTSRYA